NGHYCGTREPPGWSGPLTSHIPSGGSPSFNQTRRYQRPGRVQLVPMPAGDEDCYSMGLYCANVDETVAKAEAAGATIREPLSTFVSGDRFASIRDPFGVRWSVMSRVEDLSEEESANRLAEWAAEQSG
ncbi:VOC family protein, partial [Arthrobacter gengyunqii]|uniref:VOC family protein n=1 Tax=Arthrobacter gengyunqii TaxID=2886940 RepID=UPI003C2AAFEF